ncbi:MAG: inositol-3-phosphate synthase [Candidatus Pacebacteria bacterium]|nr:inositol-3-phosphate synthase [Candidatus Paceibacterota bacterium]
MKAEKEILVAIAGLGNCASALIQAVYREKLKGDLKGVMHRDLGGYGIASIRFVAAFDVDTNKIGKDVSEAIFSGPNCTEKISDVPRMGVRVSAGPILDGVSSRMKDKFCPVEQGVTMEQVVAILLESKAEVLLNYMPVGSDEATAFYAECALQAGCGFVNCMPSFICSTPEWGERFRKAGLPCLGDDIKSQLGASVLNRSILHLFDMRGTRLQESLQKNYGNNTDFWNMQDAERLRTKYLSKTGTLTSNISPDQDVKVEVVCNGYDPTLKGDHKVCHIRIRAIGTGTEVFFESRMEVVDSYNSAGVVVDAIRVIKIALDRGISGPIIPACAYFMKSPPEQMEDNYASFLLEEWINDGSRTIICSHSRIQDFSYSGQKYSEFWTRTIKELLENARKHHLKVRVMSPKRHYHDQKEYLAVLEGAIEELLKCPQGYVRNLVIPFSVTETDLKKKMIALLQRCQGINIYGINVAPDEEFVSQVSNICGYAGMNEDKVGEELYQELVSRSSEISTVLVVRHQKNQGLEWRIRAIERKAKEDGKKVIIFGAHEQRQIKKYVGLPGLGIITLGCRGTEIILGFKSSRKTPIVCMDNNKKVNDFLGQMEVATSYSQEGFYEGIVFSGMINAELIPQKVAA